VKRLVCGATAMLLAACGAAWAQTAAIDDLKGKIFDARMAQQTFAQSLQHCDELDGKNFYFRLRNRILNLEEYFRSLENLAKAQVFNPETKRPWTLEDAKARWEQVKKEAQADKERCELVRSLPELEKRLQELEKAAAADKPADKKQ